MKLLTDILTDNTNVTYDAINVLAVLTIVVGLGLKIYAVVTGKEFDVRAFGEGMGIVFVGVGGALKLRPPDPPSVTQTTTVVSAPPTPAP